MNALPAIYRSGTTTRVPNRLFTLGDVVRKLRDLKGWNQADLAERAEVSSDTIKNLERFPNKAKRETIISVCEALQVSEADLYAYAERVSLSAAQRDWLRLLQDVGEARRPLVIDFAERQKEIALAEKNAPHSESSGDQSKTGSVTSRKARKA